LSGSVRGPVVAAPQSGLEDRKVTRNPSARFTRSGNSSRFDITLVCNKTNSRATIVMRGVPLFSPGLDMRNWQVRDSLWVGCIERWRHWFGDHTRGFEATRSVRSGSAKVLVGPWLFSCGWV